MADSRSETLRAGHKNPAVWVALAILVAFIAFSRHGTEDQRANLQTLRGILDATLVPIAVLVLPDATSDERSQALKGLETAATAAQAIETSSPCLEDAIRDVVVFLEVVGGVGTTLEPEAVEAVHRKLRDTVQAKINAAMPASTVRIDSKKSRPIARRGVAAFIDRRASATTWRQRRRADRRA